MKVLQLFAKGFLLVALWAIGAYLINRSIGLPYSWVTDRMLVCDEKLHSNEYNTVFIGCSKTFHGIVPDIFDEMVTKHSDLEVNSMNFGLGGANAGQIFGLAKSMIDDPTLDLDYIFMELRSVDNMILKKAFRKNLHTFRDRIWMTDFQVLKFGLRSLWGVKEPTTNFFLKMEFSVYMFVKYIENQLNIGGINKMRSRLHAEPNKELEFSKEGFIEIESNPYANSAKLRKKFMKDVDRTLKNAIKAAHVFASKKAPQECEFYNEPYAEEINKLIEYADSKGIKLMIVALPMLKAYDYKNVYPILASVPKGRQLNLADPKDCSELYYLEHCWDDTHTNLAGAEAQTHRLVQKFLKSQTGQQITVPYWDKKKAEKKAKKKKKKLSD